MDLITLYAIALISSISLYPLLRLLRQLIRRYLIPWLHPLKLRLRSVIPVLLARHAQYPLLLPRRHWMSITRLESLILALYFAANGAILFFGKVNIGSTTAMLAVINAIPLFLGGRTNPVADFAGIPLSTYYISHHFIGRVVIAEAILHGALALKRSKPDQITISGYTVSLPPHG